MKQYNPDATWVIQAWLGNPKKELLAGLDRKHTLIVDLAAEFWDNWRKRKGFDGFPWLWSHISNYGANIGLHGRLDAIATGPIDGRKDPEASPSMKGTSSTPEGIEVNPVVFDLLNEMLLHDIAKPACRTADKKGVDHFSPYSLWNLFRSSPSIRVCILCTS